METVGFSAASGQAQFLELFVAQLQNQDPLEPVGQQDFLGQLAQFSTVEGLEKLNVSQSTLNSQFAELLQIQTANAELNLLSDAAALLGKTVSFETEEAESLTGIATELKRESGQILVQVGDHLVPVSDIGTISTAETP